MNGTYFYKRRGDHASGGKSRERYRFWPAESGQDWPRHDAPGVIEVRVYCEDGLERAVEKAGLTMDRVLPIEFIERLQASPSR